MDARSSGTDSLVPTGLNAGGRWEDAIPDSVGKRKRRDVTARKAVAREERRVARAARRKDREAGLIEAGPPIGPAEQSEWLPSREPSDGSEEEGDAGS
ncbi:MAG TPA: hypothetical protein VF984_03525 [Actinomycetota bacterium]